jgi:hypothetical protein
MKMQGFHIAVFIAYRKLSEEAVFYCCGVILTFTNLINSRNWLLHRIDLPIPPRSTGRLR